MVKPGGTFVYFISPGIAGAGGAVTKDLIGSDDANGDRLSTRAPIWAFFPFDAVFVPSTLATAGANGGRCEVNTAIVTNNGVITTFTVEVTNRSPAAGDAIEGFLYVTVLRRENMAL